MRRNDDAINKLTLAMNAIVLAYIVTLASICGKRELWCAIAVDVLFVSALTLYRFWRSRRPSHERARAELNKLVAQNRVLARLDKGWSSVSLMVLSVGCVYLSLDFVAFAFATCGKTEASSVVYRTIAPPVVLGLHPAFSLELLAGSCIEAKSFARAENMEWQLLDIRKSIVGEHHELIAAMEANMGDLFVKEHKFDAAEGCYHRAIQLTRELRLPQGYGSPMTKLACLLRDERKYDESQQAFEAALAIRSRIFGETSAKVGETLTEYAKLRDLQELPVQATRLRESANRTSFHAGQSESTTINSSLISLFFALASLVALSQRTRITTWFLRRATKSA